MTAAILSKVKWSVQNNSTSPATYAEIKEVRTAQPPMMQKPLVKVTHFQSSVEEYITGLADGNEIPLTGNLIIADTGQGVLATIFDSGAARYFKAELQDSSGSTVRTITFLGV